MKSLLSIITNARFSLIVSLPKNDYNLAKAAWESGADAIKVHINVKHNASKQVFEDLTHYRDTFINIIKDSPVPVGIVIGNSVDIAEEALSDVLKMGFDFISLYGRDMPIILGFNRPIETFYAIDHAYQSYELNVPNITDILELSIQNPTEYGRRFTLQDLLAYKHIVNQANKPCIIPSQLKFEPTDIKSLAEIGIKGLMIGAIVTGHTVESMTQSVYAFKQAILAIQINY